jgi:uncharacterized protein YkwD
MKIDTSVIIIIVIALFFFVRLIIKSNKKKKGKPRKQYPIDDFEYRPGSDQEKILFHINAYREDYKSNPLRPSRFLNIQAEIRIDEFIENHIKTGKLDHTGYADNHTEVIKQGATIAGENLAFGGTAQGVVRRWFKKETEVKHVGKPSTYEYLHRKNMVSKNYDMVGIHVKEYKGRKYYCAFFAGTEIID